MSNLTMLDNTFSNSVSREPASTTPTADTSLSLDLIIAYIDDILSAIANKGLPCNVLATRTKLRDLVQPIASDLPKLLEGISKGANLLSDQKFSTSKLSTEAQTVAVDVLKGVGSAHWAAVGFLVIAKVLEKIDKISVNDRECIDILKGMLDLAKYIKQLKDINADLRRQFVEKMSEAVQLIICGAILCHSYIGSNKISKFLSTSKIREELVYVRGKVDSMKSDLVLQMQFLLVSTFSIYISTRHNEKQGIPKDHGLYNTGETDEIKFLEATDQLSSAQSNDFHSSGEAEDKCKTEVYESESSEPHIRSSKRQYYFNKINGYHHKLGRFLKKINPILTERKPASPTKEESAEASVLYEASPNKQVSPFIHLEMMVKEIRQSALEFTGEELLNATNGYGEEIGIGGSGTVYIGTLSGGRKVAVKKMVTEREWLLELRFLSELQHPNIVKLVGYCFRDDLMLVYEYMARGNLSDLLLDAESKHIIDWPTRLKIILDVIRGLVYLQDGAEKCIVHRDIKPSNILLDENFNAKISDFGICTTTLKRYVWCAAEEGTANAYHHITTVAGTMGYIDPEYLKTSIVTAKSDIYSFGVLLLNVVSGKKCIQQTEKGLHRLEDHAWRLHKEYRLKEIIDPRLVNSYGFDTSSILRTITTALWCVQEETEVRPSAFKVLKYLSSEVEVPQINRLAGKNVAKLKNLAYIM